MNLMQNTGHLTKNSPLPLQVLVEMWWVHVWQNSLNRAREVEKAKPTQLSRKNATTKQLILLVSHKLCLFASVGKKHSKCGFAVIIVFFFKCFINRLITLFSVRTSCNV